jgi:hypothetical protein
VGRSVKRFLEGDKVYGYNALGAKNGFYVEYTVLKAVDIAPLPQGLSQGQHGAVFLVCITRTTGRAEVSRALNYAFPPGVIQEVDLGRPSSALVRSLIDKLLPKSSPMHRDAIGRFVRQSYFGAVFVCTLLSCERKLPQSFQPQYLRDHVCRQPLAESTREVCPIETALRGLAVYAALSPVPKDNVQVRELAAQLSGLATEQVEVLLNRVLAAGLFQEYGRARVRPVPDLFGDLILEEACLDTQGKPTAYSSTLIDRVFELDAHARS